MQPRREVRKLAVLVFVIASVASAAPQVGIRSSNKYVQVKMKGINVHTLVDGSALPVSDLLFIFPSHSEQLPGVHGVSRPRAKTSPEKAPIVVAVVFSLLASPCRRWMHHPLPHAKPKKTHGLASQSAHIHPGQTFGAFLQQTEEVHRDA